MAIKAGDKMPAGTFKTWGKDDPQDLTTDELFRGKTVVLFSVPGAFTPTCDAKHLPVSCRTRPRSRRRASTRSPAWR